MLFIMLYQDAYALYSQTTHFFNPIITPLLYIGLLSNQVDYITHCVLCCLYHIIQSRDMVLESWIREEIPLKSGIWDMEISPTPLQNRIKLTVAVKWNTGSPGVGLGCKSTPPFL